MKITVKAVIFVILLTKNHIHAYIIIQIVHSYVFKQENSFLKGRFYGSSWKEWTHKQ